MQQPFELPDLYMPWPARLNPNLEAARKNSKAWAYEVGILGSEEEAKSSIIWNEKTFDAHDYALFSAYVHPDVSGEELDLLTYWYIWLFFFDDYFLDSFKRTGDMAGAKEYLKRLPAFMLIDTTEISPVPTNPLECGLAYLWSRTVSTKSINWQRRFLENTVSQFEASLCELSNISQNRFANPIEYIEMRRIVGGATWAAVLTEHPMIAEMPIEITTSRPMCVLRDTFADAVHLHNDLFSYQKEREDEGEHSNCVMVFEQFLNIDPQRAANITNNLHTSRVQQFEHTVVTELPLLFEEYKVEPEARLNILLYVKALRDWLSGGHEWHQCSGRYTNNKKNASSTPILSSSLPTGLGISAACVRSFYDTMGFRLKNYTHIPYQAVGVTMLPNFYMPFSSPSNIHLETARKYSKQWTRQMGMLDPLPHYPNSLIWDEHKFDAADIALLCAFWCPSVSTTQLILTTCWSVWATYADDYMPKVYGNNRDLTGAKNFVTRLSEFLPIDLSISVPVPANPVEYGLNNLWMQTVENLPTDKRNLLRYSIETYATSWLWELANHVQNRIPDPIDYVEMRRKTVAADLTMVFPQLNPDEEIPSEIYSSQIMREITKSAIDCTWITNDIFSYRKEIEFEGELNNGVLVVQNFLNCNSSEAISIINNLATARIRQFEHLIETELSIFLEHFNLDTETSRKIFNYIENLKIMMYASLQWHRMVDRYKESELQNERLRRSMPITTGGLGTSAARIGTLLKARKTKTMTESVQSVITENNGLGTSAIRIVAMLKANQG